MARSCFFKFAVVGVIFLLCSPVLTCAQLTNGDFSDGLNGWTVEPEVEPGGVGAVMVIGEAAVFLGPGDFDEDFISSSILSQTFMLEADAQTLSFEVLMESYDPGGETDVFTVKLLDDSDNPLVFIPGETYFYYLDSAGNEDMAAGVSVADNTVSVGVSSWAGQDVKLIYELFHDYTDSNPTRVILDDVNVSAIVIPAPGALMLGSIGATSLVWLRKRKIL